MSITPTLQKKKIGGIFNFFFVYAQKSKKIADSTGLGVYALKGSF
jgi:hypothetical protein